MNAPIRRLFLVSVFLFASLIAMLAYRQVIEAQDLADRVIKQNVKLVWTGTSKKA